MLRNGQIDFQWGGLPGYSAKPVGEAVWLIVA